jgi:hypothetical protein
MLEMSEDLRICSKCGARTLEHTIDCIVPSEMAGLLQEPIPVGPDLRVMIHFCSSCRCVELHAAGGHVPSEHLAKYGSSLHSTPG